MADEPLIPGVDYYLEEERWVFTAHFLKKRGYCCESGAGTVLTDLANRLRARETKKSRLRSDPH